MHRGSTGEWLGDRRSGRAALPFCAFSGGLGSRSARFGAEVIAAGWPSGLLGGGGPAGGSAGGRWERFESLEGGLEFCDPGPCVLQVELRAPSGER